MTSLMLAKEIEDVELLISHTINDCVVNGECLANANAKCLQSIRCQQLGKKAVHGKRADSTQYSFPPALLLMGC